MKKIALFPKDIYDREKLTAMQNAELIALAEKKDCVAIYELEEFIAQSNDSCFFPDDWHIMLNYPDRVWSVDCEWKTDCDGVQFESHLFHSLTDAQEYFRKEREDRISDYQRVDYDIEGDTDTYFAIQADEWDTYEQLWIREKEIV